MAIAGNGNIAVATHLSDQSGLGVFVTIYSRTGIVIVPQFRVNDGIDGDQIASSMAMNANGQLVVAFTTAITPSQGQEAIYVRRFQANGAAVTGDVLVYARSTTVEWFDGIDAGIDSVGNFVVTWSYNNYVSTESTDVFARRYSSNGALLGSTFSVNTNTAGPQSSNRIAMQDNGSFVIGWLSRPQNGCLILGRRYN